MLKERMFTTVLHLVELAGVLLAAWFITWVLKVELPAEVLAVVFAAIAKFARTGSKDWVNDR